MIRLNRKGQNTLEYVLLVTAVVVAFLLIQYYLNRGLQGRMREASDNIGGQFDADVTAGNYKITRSSTTTETDLAGVSRTELLTAEDTLRLSAEEVAEPDGALPAIPALPTR